MAQEPLIFYKIMWHFDYSIGFNVFYCLILVPFVGQRHGGHTFLLVQKCTFFGYLWVKNKLKGQFKGLVWWYTVQFYGNSYIRPVAFKAHPSTLDLY